MNKEYTATVTIKAKGYIDRPLEVIDPLVIQSIEGSFNIYDRGSVEVKIVESHLSDDINE